MKDLILSLAAAAALNIPPVLAANSCSAQSPAYRIALLELYTSEGCSSCPPADQYISGLRGEGITAQQAVLLSEHVDYWYNLGWKDPFSSKTFTERQRWMSELANSRTIYTPEIFIGSKEQRGWPRGIAETVKRINGLAAQADLGITLGTINSGGLPLAVTARSAREGKLFVALVQSGVASQVKAGENSGRLLRHDFVVRAWLAPVALSSGSAAINKTIPLPAGVEANKLSVSVFVQTDQGEVLQALSLPVCGG